MNRPSFNHLFLQAYAQEHPQYEDHQLSRNKELEQVLEPKEGEEVVLYEVLDKDIKSSSSKQRSHRKDSQSEQQPEVCTVYYQVAFSFFLVKLSQQSPHFLTRDDAIQSINPLIPISDQDRISPYNIHINQISDENKEKYPFEDDKLINTKLSELTL